MSTLASLLLLLVVGRVFGELFHRWGQPRLMGEMLSGFVLGPGLLGLIAPSQALAGISELAMFLIIFSAGLEMNMKDVLNAFRGRGMIVAALAFLIPFTSGLSLGAMFDQDAMRTVFLGLCVSITALPVAIRVLSKFGVLNSAIGRYSIGSAVINDVAALLMLGIILNLPEHHTVGTVAFETGVSLLKLLIFGAVIFGVNRLMNSIRASDFGMARVTNWMRTMFGNEALFGIVVVFVLGVASVGELLGTHFVIGAFFGSLLLDRKLFAPARYVEMEKTITSISDGFIGPLFFAYLGLEFSPSAFENPGFVISVIALSIISKVLAGWMGGRIVGMSHRDAWGLGAILNGRGVMELVVANIALNRGFIGQELFSTLVLMGIVTTMITPLLFRWIRPDGLAQTESSSAKN